MSIDEAGPLCARTLPLFYCNSHRLITDTSKTRASVILTTLLSAALLCADCVGPLRASNGYVPCGDALGDNECNENQSSCDCVHQPGCYGCCCCWIARECLCVICLPCRVCRGTLNLCAHNDAVGPPDVQGPGRFHPVPTHPVFAPLQDEIANGEQP